MKTNNSWRNLADAALEEWFLDHLPESAACFDQLLEVITHFETKLSQHDKAEACADLLQESLKKSPAEDELLQLLECRAGWQSDLNTYAVMCLQTLADFFKGRNLMRIFLESCGLQGGLHPREALRRLRVLRKLQPGTYCYEKTWGLGTVSNIDEFDGKIVIDFEKKPGHRLAFSYAAETVQPLDNNHFLALKLRNSEAFRQWVKDNPAETVKAMLSHFGEMSPTRLRSLFVALVFPENEWNSFWSVAREKLASDPLLQIPANRSEPIRILTEKQQFDDRWRESFMAERDISRILTGIESLFKHCAPQNLSADLKHAVEDRLAFAARGTGAEQQNIMVQILLLADAAGIGPEHLFDISIYNKPEFLVEAFNSMSARMIRPLLAYLDQKNHLPAVELLPKMFPRLSLQALSETILYCRQNGREEQVFSTLRSLLETRSASADMISWVSRNLELVCEKGVCRPETLAQAGLDLLKDALVGGRKKEASQMLALFTNKALLKDMLQAMDGQRRLDFCKCIGALNGLTAFEQNEINVKIIILFPALAGAFSAPATTVARPKLTSYRSYRERQAQLEKIIKEEIPRNSKEIGVARGYGDLRENYEYKAAREMQALLMRRKAEYEQMLSEVRGADFADGRHDVAGLGTSVELKMPDGTGKTYHILGEWDSDEQLGIISCRSKLAEALSGHRAGDSVEIPGENGGVVCVIVKVAELPAEIRAWIHGA